MSAELLIDNSAWSRLRHPTLARDRAEEIFAAFEAGRIATCLPFLLDAGYSARSASDHATLFERLRALPDAAVDDRVQKRALDAQRQLALTGHHRLPAPDLLLAGVADRHGLGVLHYDSDYDLIAERTDLRFDSVWLAERGSL
ncbi:MAG: PIN domain-containing protein [Solirubrobacteraceae bacterium]